MKLDDYIKYGGKELLFALVGPSNCEIASATTTDYDIETAYESVVLTVDSVRFDVHGESGVVQQYEIWDQSDHALLLEAELPTGRVRVTDMGSVTLTGVEVELS